MRYKFRIVYESKSTNNESEFNTPILVLGIHHSFGCSALMLRALYAIYLIGTCACDALGLRQTVH